MVMAGIQQAMAGLAGCGGTAAELSAFLAGVREEGGDVLLWQLAGVSREAERLLSPDVLKGWPEDGLGLYVDFLAAMPYRPDPKCMPCGKKERFIAAALADRSVPKAARIVLWRAFAMNGFRFPRYAKGSWDVPAELLDHMAVRGWVCARRLDGWQDLRNSDPSFFADPKVPDFKTDFEKSAWEAIGEDSPSGLVMPLAILGQGVPLPFFREVLRAGAVKCLIYILSDPDLASFRMMSPRDLLFYVCANWNNDASIPVVSMLEKAEPGLVASAVDCHGHNALWYTLYQRDSRGIATPAARREMDPLDLTLIRLGCDPAKECFLGLSWQDVAEDAEAVAEWQARFGTAPAGK